MSEQEQEHLAGKISCVEGKTYPPTAAEQFWSLQTSVRANVDHKNFMYDRYRTRIHGTLYGNYSTGEQVAKHKPCSKEKSKAQQYGECIMYYYYNVLFQ